MSPVGIRLPDRFTHLLESMGLPLPSVVTVATMEKSSETEKNSSSTNKRILIGLALEEDLMRFHATASLQFYIGTFLATIISRGFVPEEFSGTVLLQYFKRNAYTTYAPRLTKGC